MELYENLQKISRKGSNGQRKEKRERNCKKKVLQKLARKLERFMQTVECHHVCLGINKAE